MAATALVCLGIIAVSLIFRRYFIPYLPTAFFGDDLSLVISYDYLGRTKTLGELFTSSFAAKYRPIFELSFMALVKGTAQRLEAMFVVLGVLHVVCGAVVFLIAHLLCRSTTTALLLALCVAQSNFALYQVTQASGVLEVMATLFCLLTVLFVIWPRPEALPSRIGLALAAVACSWLASYTHERYLLVNLVLALLFASGAYVHGPLRWVLALPPLLTIAGNFVTKHVLGLTILLGTDGKPIDVDLWRSLNHLLQATLSIFGANYGPEYLTGMNVVVRRDWLMIAGAALFMLLFTAVLLAAARIVRRTESGWHGFLVPLFLLGTLGAILLPAISTIRVEQRWLHMPLAVVLLFFAWGLGALAETGGRRIAPAVAAAVAVILVAAHERTLAGNPNIFFVYAGRVASDLHADIVRTGGRDHAPVVLIAAPEHCDWTLLQGKFFEFYQGLTRDLACVPDIDQASRRLGLASSRVFLHLSNQDGLTEVTNAAWPGRAPNGGADDGAGTKQ